MSMPKLSDSVIQEAVNLVAQHGSPHFASIATGVPSATLASRCRMAVHRGITSTAESPQLKVTAAAVGRVLTAQHRPKVGRSHLVIPDVQAKPEAPNDHLEWIANYAIEHRPDMVIQIGDWGDMPSLSVYDKGKRSAEGRRYVDDIDATRASVERFERPIDDYNRTHTDDPFDPDKEFLYGNHEHRVVRAGDLDPAMHGKLSLDDFGFEDYGWNTHPFLEVVTFDGVEYCLAPHHKVLTADLRWVQLGDLAVGDELIGFEESAITQRSGRKYKTSVVEQHDLDTAQLFEVTLSDGTVFNATADHRWLIRNTSTGLGWVHTRDLKLGHGIPRLFDVWDEDLSKDAGWLAGIFDGEGHISKPNAEQGGIQLGVAQNDGAVQDRIKDLLTHFGADFSTHSQNGGGGRCKSMRVLGPSSDKLRLMGTVRPERLIKKFKPEMLGRVQARDGDAVVVKIRPIGLGTIVKLKTSTGTFIADGFPHHNCHYFTSGDKGLPVSSAAALLALRQGSATMGHVQRTDIAMHKKTQRIGLFCGICYLHDEKYLGPQGNGTRRQIIMKREVADGKYDLEFISLEQLRKRYS